MSYKIVVERKAQRFISKQPKNQQIRILSAINKLPSEGDIKRMQGAKNAELYRLRVGDYRIIYTVDNGQLIVCVVAAGNRGDIYKDY